MPTYSHRSSSLGLKAPEQPLKPDPSVAQMLAKVPLKEDIGPVLKKWYNELDVREGDVGSHKPTKQLHRPVKPPLNTNNQSCTMANLAAARATAKLIEMRTPVASGAGPVVDFTKAKLKRIENDLDSLLLPGEGVDPDGSAARYSPPHSARTDQSGVSASAGALAESEAEAEAESYRALEGL